jgi:hypothetical protein
MTDTTDSPGREDRVPEDSEDGIETAVQPDPDDFVDEGIGKEDKLDAGSADPGGDR